MTSRITWDGKSTSLSIDWNELVTMPASQGYFIQAFASADAIIDNTAESLLRQLFNGNEAQLLINNLHRIRGSVSFDGNAILRILENNDIVDQKLRSRIIRFKEARNTVLHTIEAEYGLISYDQMVAIKTQEEYDARAQSEAKQWLAEASHIFNQLLAAFVAVPMHRS